MDLLTFDLERFGYDGFFSLGRFRFCFSFDLERLRLQWDFSIWDRRFCCGGFAFIRFGAIWLQRISVWDDFAAVLKGGGESDFGSGCERGARSKMKAICGLEERVYADWDPSFNTSKNVFEAFGF